MRLPKYRKHSRTHSKQALAFVELSGKRHYLGKYGSKASRTEYDRLVAEWLASGRQLPPTADETGLTVTHVCVVHFRYLKTYYRTNPGSAKNCQPALRVLRRLYGHTLAKEFGPLALKAVLAEFRAGGAKPHVQQHESLACEARVQVGG